MCIPEQLVNEDWRRHNNMMNESAGKNADGERGRDQLTEQGKQGRSSMTNVYVRYIRVAVLIN